MRAGRSRGVRMADAPQCVHFAPDTRKTAECAELFPWMAAARKLAVATRSCVPTWSVVIGGCNSFVRANMVDRRWSPTFVESRDFHTYATTPKRSKGVKPVLFHFACVPAGPAARAMLADAPHCVTPARQQKVPKLFSWMAAARKIGGSNSFVRASMVDHRWSHVR